MNHPLASASASQRDDLPEPTGGFVWRQVPWGLALACPALDPMAVHLFTTRDLEPGSGLGPDPAWERIAAYLDVPDTALVRLNQVHGRHTLHVSGVPAQAPAVLPSADAAVSERDAIGLVVKAADCVPILLADRGGRGVAAVHAGWRGTAQAVAMSAVEALTLGGSLASDLVAAIGPSIGACCYEVGPEVRDGFARQAEASGAGDRLPRWFAPGLGERQQLDLWQANRDQLIAAGVPASSIHVAGLCTACHPDRFFSYRREGARAGRLLAAIRKR